MFNPFDWFYKKKYEMLKREHEDLWKVVDFYIEENEKLEKEIYNREKEVEVFKQYCEHVNSYLDKRISEPKTIDVDGYINLKL